MCFIIFSKHAKDTCHTNRRIIIFKSTIAKPWRMENGTNRNPITELDCFQLTMLQYRTQHRNPWTISLTHHVVCNCNISWVCIQIKTKRLQISRGFDSGRLKFRRHTDQFDYPFNIDTTLDMCGSNRYF
jgi:hypothetical protein